MFGSYTISIIITKRFLYLISGPCSHFYSIHCSFFQAPRSIDNLTRFNNEYICLKRTRYIAMSGLAFRLSKYSRQAKDEVFKLTNNKISKFTLRMSLF